MLTLTDTVTNTVYDTTYVRVPYPVHDTSYITLTDTVTNTVYDTIVLDTLTLTQYVPVHDTTYIRVPVHDTTIVTIPLDTIFVTDTVTLTQTVYVPLFDTTYIPVHDTTYIPVQVHDTTVVTNTVYDTAYVDRYIHDTTYVSVTVHDTTVVTQFDTVNITLYDTVYVGAPTYHRLSVRSGNDLMGVGAGSGYFPVNTTVEIAAVPQYGFAFLRWLDGNTENPRTVVVEDADATYTALFAVTNTPEGIDGNDDAWGYDVSTSRDIITVRGAEGHNIKVYDMSGRVLASQRDAAEVQSFRVPATGTYLVQVDGLPAKKVVVIK